MDRRGFIGGLSGLPIAAVAQPRIAIPEVSASPSTDIMDPASPTINITINGPFRSLTTRDRDELARIIGDSLTSQALRPRGSL